MDRGDGELRSNTTEMVGRCGAPVHGCDDVELGELIDVVGSANHEHVMGQVIDVVPITNQGP